MKSKGLGWLVVLVLLTTSSACKTTAPADTSSGSDAALQAARDAHTLPMPPDPLYAVSLRPTLLQEAAERLEQRYAGRQEAGRQEAGRQEAGEQEAGEQETSPYTHLADRLIARMLAGGSWQPTRMLRASNGPAASSGADLRLEALDRGRPLYIAASAAPYRRWLRHLRLAVPTDDTSLIDRGMATRLILPAEKPEELVAELKSHCQGDDDAADGKCEAVTRTAAAGGWVTVDLLTRTPSREKAEPPTSGATSPSSDAGFFERVTPATLAFFAPDAAVAVYGRADTWWALGSVRETLATVEGQVSDDGYHPAPEWRRVVFNRLQRRLVALTDISSPQAREYEDATLQLHVDESTVTADLVRTFTERGQRVARARTQTPNLATLGLQNPMLRLQWSGDLPAALDAAAAPPDWLKRIVSPRSRYARIEGVMQWIPWGGVAALLHYPLALTGSLEHLYVDDEMTPVDGLQRLTDLKGLRLGLDLAADPQSSLGVSPRAAAVLLLPSDSNLDASLQSWVTLLEAQGLPASFSVDERGEDIVVKLSVGLEDHAFGEPAPVDKTDGLSLTIDLTRLHRQLAGTPYERLAAGLGSDTDRLPRRLVYHSRHGELGSVHRLAIGTVGEAPSSPAAPPTLETEQVTPQPAQGPPNCLSDGIERFRIISEARHFPRWEAYLDGLLDSIDPLAADERACREQGHEEAAEDLRWMRRAALRQAADFQRRLHRHADAEATLRQLCELVGEQAEACEEAEAMTKRADTHRLPRVRALETVDGPLPHRFIAVDSEGLSFDGRRIAYAKEKFTEAMDELFAGRKVVQRAENLAFHSRKVVPMAPDAGVPFERLKMVVDSARRTAPEKLDDPDLRPSHGINPDRSGKPQGVWWLLHQPEGSRPSAPPTYLYTQFWTGDLVGSRQPPVEVRITKKGVQLGYQGEDWAPVEDCPTDGPTICGDIEQLRERLRAFRKTHPSHHAALIRVDDDVDYRRFAEIVAGVTLNGPEATRSMVTQRMWNGGLFSETYLVMEE